MLSDHRSIWREDQYHVLAPSSQKNGFYFGREKHGGYQVFLRLAGSSKRRWIQTVSLAKDWYWDPKTERLVAEPLEPTATTEPTEPVDRCETVLEGFSYNGLSFGQNMKNLSDVVTRKQCTLATGAKATWLMPENPKGWILSLHGGPESFEGDEIRYGGLYRDLVKQRLAVVVLNYRGSKKLKRGVSKQAWRRWEESNKSKGSR